MSSESEKGGQEMQAGRLMPGRPLTHELAHLQSSWRWIFALGVLLMICGAIAIIFPVITSAAAVSVLAALLLIGGAATIIGSFWAGKWSGFLIELLVGILYVAGGVTLSDNPLVTTVMLTFFIAVTFIALGLFRAVAALIVRFSQWGWALLNGVVTFICGMVIYRHLQYDALWVIGFLVGLELLFNGWTWIMIAQEIHDLPAENKTAA